ncbi:MAG: hypothetical protein OEM04_00450 [Flavobacteriaceae bacterium]|nr:hypothetical protein [Flavobacteriaceae bacterium]
MKHLISIIILTITLISCNKKDTIGDAFDCKTPSHFTNSKEYKDILKHFKIKIPKDWKTSLYYDEFQSELYSADTTKQLSETYIADITWHQGELDFNEAFEKKIHQNLIDKEQLKIIKSGYGEFINHKSYYNLSTGINTDITYHYLQIYLQYSVDEYYTFTSKIYGDEFVNERICASISLFKNIEFIK